MDSAVVAAFSDSPRVRETLSVLLEHECDLRVLPTGALQAETPLCADLALVAAPGASAVLHHLFRRWPTLPVIRVDMTARRGARLRPPRDGAHVQTVPLDPHAIRSAVLHELARHPEVALRGTVGPIVNALRHEIGYALAALRAFADLYGREAEPASDAILSAVTREQVHVLGRCLEQLETFRLRPRAVETARTFGSMFCRELERADTRSDERGMLCGVTVTAAAAHPPGPVALAGILAALLWAHLRRHAEPSTVALQATPDGVTLRFPQRGTAVDSDGSWPLVLASLALQPYCWHLGRRVADGRECLTLHPLS
jgi:hypothetical protein